MSPNAVMNRLPGKSDFESGSMRFLTGIVAFRPEVQRTPQCFPTVCFVAEETAEGKRPETDLHKRKQEVRIVRSPTTRS
jgi:hypothetical protein